MEFNIYFLFSLMFFFTYDFIDKTPYPVLKPNFEVTYKGLTESSG